MTPQDDALLKATGRAISVETHAEQIMTTILGCVGGRSWSPTDTQDIVDIAFDIAERFVAKREALMAAAIESAGAK